MESKTNISKEDTVVLAFMHPHLNLIRHIGFSKMPRQTYLNVVSDYCTGVWRFKSLKQK